MGDLDTGFSELWTEDVSGMHYSRDQRVLWGKRQAAVVNSDLAGMYWIGVVWAMKC